MKYLVELIHPKDWEMLSEKAHLAVFDTHKPKELDRIDFALLVKTESDEWLAYATCREHDAHSLYWQYGGAFPGTRDSSMSFQAYRAFAEYCQARYKRISTLVENTNVVYMKFLMKTGFRIVGLRNFHGSILLEHMWEKTDEV